ncbi:MAG: thymidylate kinase, partial [Caldiserica bacterium]|nr:thymidylate kinase [Caldisericota bacterium]
MMNNNEYSGKLIAVEGLDGSGKSTQIYLLHKWLEGMNYKVFFSPWNSSELVKNCTKKGKKKQILTPTTFSLIHATDFTDRYERQLLPMLKAGYLVLCDRYVFTALARDHVRGCDDNWVSNVYSFAVKPDITFYFRLPLEVALGRILSGRTSLKYFEAGMDMGFSDNIKESFKIFQGNVYQQYELLSKQYDFVV